MQKILRYVYDIVLCTTNRYFTLFIEAVNLEQTLTVQYSLNGNTHILAELSWKQEDAVIG